jgi:tetratricopeptide (TPR) repeat protein
MGKCSLEVETYCSIVGFIISYYITITDILKRIVNVNKEIKSIKDKLQSVPNPKSNIVVEDPNNERLEINESLIQEIVSNSNIINLSFFTIEEIKKICYLLYNNEYYDLAVKYFQALYEKDKSDYTPLLNAGFILSKKLLRHDKSNELYDVIIGKSPEYAGAYYNKACNYVRMNDLDNARKNIQIAFGKDRNLYEFTKKDLELNPMRDTIDEIFNKIN